MSRVWKKGLGSLRPYCWMRVVSVAKPSPQFSPGMPSCPVPSMKKSVEAALGMAWMESIAARYSGPSCSRSATAERLFLPCECMLYTFIIGTLSELGLLVVAGLSDRELIGCIINGPIKDISLLKGDTLLS